MELPTDIWDMIVKQSKKTNADIIADMDLQQLELLEALIKDKKKRIYNAIKNKLDKYDVIDAYSIDNKYINSFIVIDKNITNINFIKVCKLVSGNKKTIFGNYMGSPTYNEYIDLSTVNIKIKKKLQDNYTDNVKIANSLKVGDVFCYSMYSCAEYVKYKTRIRRSLEDGLRYDVVIDMTPDNIIIIKYFRINNFELSNDISSSIEFVNKKKVLYKINYDDNADEYIKSRKHLFTRCLLAINKLRATDIKQYFCKVRKYQIKHMITVQKRLGLR